MRSAAAAVAAFLAPFLAAAPASAEALDATKVDQAVEGVMRVWDQPGLGLAVVEDGQAIVRGYGVRDTATRLPVDADTEFALASCSKQFGSATAAALVGAGRLGWDDKVVRYVPWFSTGDAWTTAALTVRDLFAHRSGLVTTAPREDMPDRESYLRTIAGNTPLHGFREAFSYTNAMVTLGGAVVSSVAGESWEAFAKQTLWDPIGMTRTNGDHLAARADADAASPHMRVDGKFQPVEWDYEDRVALPSGGVNSTPRDMSRWLRFLLEHGAIDGRQVVPAAALEETQRPQTPVRGKFADTPMGDVLGRGADGVSFESYGLGWYTMVYRGNRLVYHPGGIDGFKCVIGLLPDRGLGVVVLANAENPELPHAIFMDLVDQDLGYVPTDWGRRFKEYRDAIRARVVQRDVAADAARTLGASPPRALKSYVGTFSDPGAGTVTVSADGSALKAVHGLGVYDLVPWHDDTFEFVRRGPYRSPDRHFGAFSFDADDAASALRLFDHPLRRQPDAAP